MRFTAQRPASPGLDAILGVSFPVLDHGSVTAVDYMGNDDSILTFARASTGSTSKGDAQDTRLLRQLMRERHTGPFEACEISFHLRAPVMVWWQMVRHRTHSRNLESGRYKELEWLVQRTASDAWRLQSKGNKQGSSGMLTEWPDDPARTAFRAMMAERMPVGQYLTLREGELLAHMQSVYQERLKLGVAREQARKEVPFSLYYEGYDKVDLHNLFGFLSLRLAGDAQEEIREYAAAMADIASKWVPRAYQAFRDYRLDAVTLSRLDVEALRVIFHSDSERRVPESAVEEAGNVFSNKRERGEFADKLARILGHEVG